MDYPNHVECTADEWADFCAKYDVHCTEGRKNYSSDERHPLLVITNDTNTVIGAVRYIDNVNKSYSIFKNYAGPTIASRNV